MAPGRTALQVIGGLHTGEVPVSVIFRTLFGWSDSLLKALKTSSRRRGHTCQHLGAKQQDRTQESSFN